MIKYLRKIFDTSEKDVIAIQPIVSVINDLEPEIQVLTDEQLRDKTTEFTVPP